MKQPQNSAPATAHPDAGKKWTQIDGLRALAVSGVMLDHWGPEWIGPAGGFGVRLFFTISGFLITGILLARREELVAGRTTFWAEIKTFYARRTLRIFPPYYALLAIFAILGLLGYDIVSGMLWHVAYLSNFFIFRQGVWPGHYGHLWSLAVEEQFYLIWPAVIFLTPARALRPLFGALIVGAFAFRIALFMAGFNLAVQVGLLLPASLDPLCLGALLAAITQRGRIAGSTLGLIGVVGACLYATILVARVHGFPEAGLAINLAIGLISFALIGGIVLGYAPNGFAWLNWAPLQYLGRRSYGVYLFHGLGAYLVDALGGARLGLWPRLVACFIVALAIASISWVVLEQPILKLKDRFEYGSRRRAAPRAASEAVV
jgi:peptidoglycan/LPS O-acetylase OafA/YrhL